MAINTAIACHCHEAYLKDCTRSAALMMRSDSRLGVRGEVDGAFALVDSCSRWGDPVACGRCVTAAGGQCAS